MYTSLYYCGIRPVVEECMQKRSFVQATLDTCLLPFAFLREAVRRHSPFGHSDRSDFARRTWFRGIRKFARVNGGVFIGSTPTLRGLRRLRSRGVKTIVNLRASFDYRKIAESLGFRYLTIPLNGKRPPEDGEIARFLRVVEDNDNLPLFFHCNRARNRTYMLLGLYRIAHDGWDACKAIAEINHFGWKKVPDDVVSYLESFSNGGLKKVRSCAAE
jgi:protein tyrosine phosphatase (PTP) superfamily phosphohydrolase (DUF442 family)